MDKKRRTIIPCARTERRSQIVLKKDDLERRRKNANAGAREVRKPPQSLLYLSDDDVKRTLCAGCSANTSILCSIAAKYASISVMCPTCLAASRTSNPCSALSPGDVFRRRRFLHLDRSWRAATALFVFECWCLIASTGEHADSKTTRRLSSSSPRGRPFRDHGRLPPPYTTTSSLLFETLCLLRRAVLCVGRCLSFPRD